MTDEKLLELALDARKNAYVPYSGYAVGAALETKTRPTAIRSAPSAPRW